MSLIQLLRRPKRSGARPLRHSTSPPRLVRDIDGYLSFCPFIRKETNSEVARDILFLEDIITNRKNESFLLRSSALSRFLMGRSPANHSVGRVLQLIWVAVHQLLTPPRFACKGLLPSQFSSSQLRRLRVQHALWKVVSTELLAPRLLTQLTLPPGEHVAILGLLSENVHKLGLPPQFRDGLIVQHPLLSGDKSAGDVLRWWSTSVVEWLRTAPNKPEPLTKHNVNVPRSFHEVYTDVHAISLLARCFRVGLAPVGGALLASYAVVPLPPQSAAARLQPLSNPILTLGAVAGLGLLTSSVSSVAATSAPPQSAPSAASRELGRLQSGHHQGYEYEGSLDGNFVASSTPLHTTQASPFFDIIKSLVASFADFPEHLTASDASLVLGFLAVLACTTYCRPQPRPGRCFQLYAQSESFLPCSTFMEQSSDSPRDAAPSAEERVWSSPDSGLDFVNSSGLGTDPRCPDAPPLKAVFSLPLELCGLAKQCIKRLAEEDHEDVLFNDANLNGLCLAGAVLPLCGVAVFSLTSPDSQETVLDLKLRARAIAAARRRLYWGMAEIDQQSAQSFVTHTDVLRRLRQRNWDQLSEPAKDILRGSHADTSDGHKSTMDGVFGMKASSLRRSLKSPEPAVVDAAREARRFLATMAGFRQLERKLERRKVLTFLKPLSPVSDRLARVNTPFPVVANAMGWHLRSIRDASGAASASLFYIDLVSTLKYISSTHGYTVTISELNLPCPFPFLSVRRGGATVAVLGRAFTHEVLDLASMKPRANGATVARQVLLESAGIPVVIVKEDDWPRPSCAYQNSSQSTSYAKRAEYILALIDIAMSACGDSDIDSPARYILSTEATAAAPNSSSRKRTWL